MSNFTKVAEIALNTERKLREANAELDRLTARVAELEATVERVGKLPTYTVTPVWDDPGGLTTVVTRHEPRRATYIKTAELRAALQPDGEVE